MEKKQDTIIGNFGLIGKHISYSFSKGYFIKKFSLEEMSCTYSNFDIQSINDFPGLINLTPNLKGLNVTIPYKEVIIPFLDQLDPKAKKIGAVNTIKISKKGKLTGYNTDYYGFKHSLIPHLKQHHNKALILGTGGASKAVAYALKQLNISYRFVSRLKTKQSYYRYTDLNQNLISEYPMVINCTPVGTHPNIHNYPDIPYQGISDKHILYDLIYNPNETTFLRFGRTQGASTINGLEMLKLQAEKSWKIWNNL